MVVPFAPPRAIDFWVPPVNVASSANAEVLRLVPAFAVIDVGFPDFILISKAFAVALILLPVFSERHSCG